MSREITENEWTALAVQVVYEIKRLGVVEITLNATPAVQRDLILAAVGSVIDRNNKIATLFASNEPFRKDFARLIFSMCKEERNHDTSNN